MRYECDAEGLEESFVEFAESWSRGESRDAQSGQIDKLLPILQRKIVAIHLHCVGAEPITDVGDLTAERLDQVDTRVYSWFAYTWVICLNELADLGNAAGRRLFATSEPKTKTKTSRPRRKS